jgi:hypothetical protein
MDTLKPSPPTIAMCSHSESCGTGRPSINRQSGESGKAITALLIARCVARRILMLSISAGCAIPIEKAISAETSLSKISSRRLCVRHFESLTPVISKVEGIIAHPATTGPASGPLPASSTPAINCHPRPTHSRSWCQRSTESTARTAAAVGLMDDSNPRERIEDEKCPSN